MLLFNFWETL